MPSNPLQPVLDFFQVAYRAHKDGEGAVDFLRRYVEFRNKQDLDSLLNEFVEAFGEDAEIIAAEPALSSNFNGGDHPDDPDKYFAGHHFSGPLMVYVMRRALGADAKDAYHKYIENVDVLVREKNKKREDMIAEMDDDSGFYTVVHNNLAPVLELKSYPSRVFLEELCADALSKLHAIKRGCDLKAGLHVVPGSSGYEDPDL